MDGLTEGRMVHYVSYNGKHQAAIVMGVTTAPRDAVDLAVFWNIHDAKGERTAGLSFHFDVPCDAVPTPGTWHWPERA